MQKYNVAHDKRPNLQACAAGSWVAAVRQAHPPAKLDHVLLLEDILHQAVVLIVCKCEREMRQKKKSHT